MNWTKYYEARRRKKKVRRIDFLETYTLTYQRLPGYEDISQKEYSHLMMEKLEERRRKIGSKRLQQGKALHGELRFKLRVRELCQRGQ